LSIFWNKNLKSRSFYEHGSVGSPGQEKRDGYFFAVWVNLIPAFVNDRQIFRDDQGFSFKGFEKYLS
jgi:hypothetical protein